METPGLFDRLFGTAEAAPAKSRQSSIPELPRGAERARLTGLFMRSAGRRQASLRPGAELVLTEVNGRAAFCAIGIDGHLDRNGGCFYDDNGDGLFEAFSFPNDTTTYETLPLHYTREAAARPS